MAPEVVSADGRRTIVRGRCGRTGLPVGTCPPPGGEALTGLIRRLCFPECEEKEIVRRLWSCGISQRSPSMMRRKNTAEAFEVLLRIAREQGKTQAVESKAGHQGPSRLPGERTQRTALEVPSQAQPRSPIRCGRRKERSPGACPGEAASRASPETAGRPRAPLERGAPGEVRASEGAAAGGGGRTQATGAAATFGASPLAFFKAPERPAERVVERRSPAGGGSLEAEEAMPSGKVVPSQEAVPAEESSPFQETAFPPTPCEEDIEPATLRRASATKSRIFPGGPFCRRGARTLHSRSGLNGNGNSRWQRGRGRPFSPAPRRRRGTSSPNPKRIGVPPGPSPSRPTRFPSSASRRRTPRPATTGSAPMSKRGRRSGASLHEPRARAPVVPPAARGRRRRRRGGERDAKRRAREADPRAERSANPSVPVPASEPVESSVTASQDGKERSTARSASEILSGLPQKFLGWVLGRPGLLSRAPTGAAALHAPRLRHGGCHHGAPPRHLSFSPGKEDPRFARIEDSRAEQVMERVYRRASTGWRSRRGSRRGAAAGTRAGHPEKALASLEPGSDPGEPSGGQVVTPDVRNVEASRQDGSSGTGTAPGARPSPRCRRISS